MANYVNYIPPNIAVGDEITITQSGTYYAPKTMGVTAVITGGKGGKGSNAGNYTGGAGGVGGRIVCTMAFTDTFTVTARTDGAVGVDGGATVIQVGDTIVAQANGGSKGGNAR